MNELCRIIVNDKKVSVETCLSITEQWSEEGRNVREQDM
jgi:hypothetical protein